MLDSLENLYIKEKSLRSVISRRWKEEEFDGSNEPCSLEYLPGIVCRLKVIILEGEL